MLPKYISSVVDPFHLSGWFRSSYLQLEGKNGLGCLILCAVVCDVKVTGQKMSPKAAKRLKVSNLKSHTPP